MMSVVKPENENQVLEAVCEAVQERQSLEILGGGSLSCVGQPQDSALPPPILLDLSGLCGISLYEPEELVLSAMAGTSIAAIESALAQHGQQLAFEPADLRRLVGLEERQSTLGGTLATNLCGPRRIKAGAARDHFLGVEAVSGRGEAFKSGGRVVKNVTGYDMCKLLTGSWGTLAIMTKLTLKVLPAAETQKTLLVMGLNSQDAVQVMCKAMGSALDLSGSSHIPVELVQGSRVREISTAASSVTALRLEGIESSVAYRMEKLKALVLQLEATAKYVETMVLDADESQIYWRDVRDVRFFSPASGRPVWRISVPPAQGAEVLMSIDEELSSHAFFDWSGGLIWLESLKDDDADQNKGNSEDGGAEVIRQAISAVNGHATLITGAQQLRSSIDVFQPQSTGVALLSQRIKHGFDPYNLLNPGRMGIV